VYKSTTDRKSSRLACPHTRSTTIAIVVEGQAMVVTSTLGRVVVTTSLSLDADSVGSSTTMVGLLPSTCVLVFDVVIGIR
jgi:hypothetical protein